MIIRNQQDNHLFQMYAPPTRKQSAANAAPYCQTLPFDRTGQNELLLSANDSFPNKGGRIVSKSTVLAICRVGQNPMAANSGKQL